MTLTQTPPAAGRSWSAGLAAAFVANLVAFGDAWLWAYGFDGLVVLLATALLLTALAGALMARTEPWRRFGAGVLCGGVLVFVAYFLLLMWIGTQIGS